MPRAGLDSTRVLDAAARIADAEGLAALTVARLAAELKVKPPSLYNHVESLDALRDGLTRRGFRELLDVSRDAAAGRSGYDALNALAYAQRAYAKQHPGLYAAMELPVAQQSENAKRLGGTYVNLILAVLRGYGLEGEEALHHVRVLRAALRGFISLELGGGFGLPLGIDESFDLLLRVLHLGLTDRANHAPGELPHERTA
ncbi:TetR/AcrR family transcriptional regulator [Deinococcus yavapaiensis]|uniref:TetR family transcriptional regulator n=1 Tax=Deinococcus yavapaiensis KR-236 TaxID=694435 RepID=A0A318S6P9_9DEIO|nr:WHG domain-containing protein [Deinococcus yavapaiensis]PYE50411.1 TetR family transcriptional regulator [Deinococcus yavapaiensis KR-236]